MLLTPHTLMQETQAHWETVLSGVDRPSAREMMAQLDLRHLLGLASGSTYGRGRKAPLLPFFTSVKREHPTKVLLVRVISAFYCSKNLTEGVVSVHGFWLTSCACTPWNLVL